MLEAAWRHLLSYGLDERVFFVVTFMAALELPYLVLNTIYYFLRPYMVDKDAKRASATLIKDCLLNHFVNIPVRLIFLYFIFDLYKYCGMDSTAETLPSTQTIVRDVFVSIFVDDTWFYWSHRTLHHQSIYKYIHKQHHQFIHTEGIAVDYAHPIEDLISNTISTLIGPLILQSHFSVVLLYAFLKVLAATALPLLLSSHLLLCFSSSTRA
jgi:sterol desaturase/sphingolipid hydroxylase (fatty acid hydroxylase superfamily)